MCVSLGLIVLCLCFSVGLLVVCLCVVLLD